MAIIYNQILPPGLSGDLILRNSRGSTIVTPSGYLNKFFPGKDSISYRLALLNGYIATNWNLLTQDQKDAWTSFSQDPQKFQVIGRNPDFTPSGFLAFITLNSNRIVQYKLNPNEYDFSGSCSNGTWFFNSLHGKDESLILNPPVSDFTGIPRLNLNTPPYSDYYPSGTSFTISHNHSAKTQTVTIAFNGSYRFIDLSQLIDINNNVFGYRLYASSGSVDFNTIPDDYFKNIFFEFKPQMKISGLLNSINQDVIAFTLDEESPIIQMPVKYNYWYYFSLYAISESGSSVFLIRRIMQL